jgi:hypothetical protein
LTIRESETIFVRCDGATTKRIFGLFVRFTVGDIKGFNVRIGVVVFSDSFVMDRVDVVRTESNIVS